MPADRSFAPLRVPRLLTVVRPEEWRPVLVSILTVLLVMTAHAFIETARDALFLTHVPVTNLPWVYLVLAVLAILVSHALENIGGRETVWRALILTQIFSGLGTLVFVLRVPFAHYWTFHALYVWGGLASTVVLIRFWMLLSERLTPTQAKRLFPLIAAGPVAGTVLGFGIAGVVGRRLGGHGLLLLSSCLFLISAVTGIGLRRAFCSVAEPSGMPLAPSSSQRAVDRARKIHGTTGFRMILRHPYVRRMTALMLAASVAATLADYLFKTGVSVHVQPHDLSPFLARTYFLFNLLSVTMLVIVTPFIRWIGVPMALAIEPALLALAAIVWSFAGGLPAVILLRGIDGSFRWSLHKTAVELLYVPMSGRLRSTVKALSDVLGHRGGQAIASLVILTTLAIQAPSWILGAVVVVAAVLWIRSAASLQRPYLELFRQTLQGEFAEPRLLFPELDLDSLESLIGALNSTEDHEVVAAMELLEGAGRARLIPALILYHPSATVVVRALELFQRAGRDDFLPITRRLLTQGNAAVSAAVVRVTAVLRPNRPQLEQSRQSERPAIVMTALVALHAHGWLAAEAARAEIAGLLERDPETISWLTAAARALPSKALVPLLVPGLDAVDVETRREAVFALGRAGDPQAIEPLIGHLDDPDVRDEIREILLGFGEDGFAALRAALGDLQLPDAVRLHLPRTIAQFGSQRAADLLLAHLTAEPRGMVRYKILRGLGRLVADHPEIWLDDGLLDAAIDRYLERLFCLLHWAGVLEAGVAADAARRTAGHELLLDLVRNKQSLALERLFRLLGLRFRGENVAHIYRGLMSDDAGVRSSSRELLESTLPPRIRVAVLGLTDDLPAGNRLAAAGSFYRPAELSYEDLLNQLQTDSSRNLSHVAAFHAAEVGLTGARELPKPSTVRLARLEGRRRPRPQPEIVPPLQRGAA